MSVQSFDKGSGPATEGVSAESTEAGPLSQEKENREKEQQPDTAEEERRGEGEEEEQTKEKKKKKKKKGKTSSRQRRKQNYKDKQKKTTAERHQKKEEKQKEQAKREEELQREMQEAARNKVPRHAVIERWRFLGHRMPLPGHEFRGIYIPPNAPPGTFFVGWGTVKEVGLNRRGTGLYVWVVPRAWNDKRRQDYPYHEHEFFDPYTNEPMPMKYLPWLVDCEDNEMLKEEHLAAMYERPKRYQIYRDPEWDFEGLEWWTRRYIHFDWPEEICVHADEAELATVKVGDECRGAYQNYDHQWYYGVLNTAYEDKAPPVTEIHYMDLPTSLAIEGQEADEFQTMFEDENKGQGAKKAPKLSAEEYGVEGYGAYLAPDGRWYVGDGRVIAHGKADENGYEEARHGFEYTLVEPIAGRKTNNFTHPITGRKMPRFPKDAPSPSAVFPWRSYFTRGLSELVPGLEDEYCLI